MSCGKIITVSRNYAWIPQLCIFPTLTWMLGRVEFIRDWNASHACLLNNCLAWSEHEYLTYFNSLFNLLFKSLMLWNCGCRKAKCPVRWTWYQKCKQKKTAHSFSPQFGRKGFSRSLASFAFRETKSRKMKTWDVMEAQVDHKHEKESRSYIPLLRLPHIFVIGKASRADWRSDQMWRETYFKQTRTGREKMK